MTLAQAIFTAHGFISRSFKTLSITACLLNTVRNFLISDCFDLVPFFGLVQRLRGTV